MSGSKPIKHTYVPEREEELSLSRTEAAATLGSSAEEGRGNWE